MVAEQINGAKQVNFINSVPSPFDIDQASEDELASAIRTLDMMLGGDGTAPHVNALSLKIAYDFLVRPGTVRENASAAALQDWVEGGRKSAAAEPLFQVVRIVNGERRWGLVDVRGNIYGPEDALEQWRKSLPMAIVRISENDREILPPEYAPASFRATH
jgi:hypothetical protein